MLKSKRKEPEVILFEEPPYQPRKLGKEAAKERDMFLRGDVLELFNCKELPKRQAKTTAEPSVGLDVKETLREVQSLATSNSTGKTKRKFEEDQVRALGAKPSKPDCVPYPHYQRVAKARKEKEKRLAEELNLPQKKKRRNGTGRNGGGAVRGKSRWKESTRSLEPGLGKFRNGVLTLSSRDLAKVKH